MITVANKRDNNTQPFGRNHGATPIDPIASYMYCEHVHAENNTVIRCANVAIIMPGYKRSCSQHVLPLLADSIAEFINRGTPHTTDAALLTQHTRDLENMQATLDALVSLAETE